MCLARQHPRRHSELGIASGNERNITSCSERNITSRNERDVTCIGHARIITGGYRTVAQNTHYVM
jgi:hypothetical protein